MSATSERDEWYIDCSDDERYEGKDQVQNGLPCRSSSVGSDGLIVAASLASFRLHITHLSLWKINDQHHWLPEPLEIQRMFETLEKSRVLDISWQCPGRKHPPSDDNNIADNDDGDEEKSPECTDFDFADEMSAPKLRRSEELRGSARKKTTSLDSVLSNMRRHRQLEESESQQVRN